MLEQLTLVRTLVNTCLDVVDVSRWTGNAKDANFIAGQFQLLHENIEEARQALKGVSAARKQWWECPVDDQVRLPLQHTFTY